MTDTEKLNEAREHLKALVEGVSEGGTILINARDNARDFLKSTEPKHPVEVEWESYFARLPFSDDSSFALVGRQAALHFAKWGMEDAADNCGGPNDFGHVRTCPCATCLCRQRIREAAAKLPKE